MLIAANVCACVLQVVVGKSLDSVFMVMEFMEHDLKQLMEDMPHPFSVAEVRACCACGLPASCMCGAGLTRDICCMRIGGGGREVRARHVR